MTEKQNHDKMQKTDKNALNFTILKYFLVTVLACVAAVFYFFAVSICLSPKSMITSCQKMGWKGGELLCYERIYDKSGKIEDLYNFTVSSINAKNNKQTILCIATLQDRNDYDAFCEKIDLSAKQTVKIEYVAYVGNLDSYLENQKVLALYNSGKKSKAKQEAFSNLESQNKYSFSLDAYVSCLGDNKAKLSALADEVFENKTILEHVDERISLLEYSSLGKIEQVMSVYTLLKVNKIKYQLLVAQDKTEQANAVQEEISRLQNEYTSLIAE